MWSGGRTPVKDRVQGEGWGKRTRNGRIDGQARGVGRRGVGLRSWSRGAAEFDLGAPACLHYPHDLKAAFDWHEDEMKYCSTWQFLPNVPFYRGHIELSAVKMMRCNILWIQEMPCHAGRARSSVPKLPSPYFFGNYFCTGPSYWPFLKLSEILNKWGHGNQRRYPAEFTRQRIVLAVADRKVRQFPWPLLLALFLLRIAGLL